MLLIALEQMAHAQDLADRKGARGQTGCDKGGPYGGIHIPCRTQGSWNLCEKLFKYKCYTLYLGLRCWQTNPGHSVESIQVGSHVQGFTQP